MLCSFNFYYFVNHFIVAFAKLKHCVEFFKGFDSVKYETNHIW